MSKREQAVVWQEYGKNTSGIYTGAAVLTVAATVLSDLYISTMLN
jgi:hypothetical protein